MFEIMVLQQNAIVQPNDHFLRIGYGILSKTKKLPDLCPMVCNRTAYPIVLREQPVGNANALRYVLHDRLGHFGFMRGEPRLVLKIFKQHGKPQPGRARFVPDLLHLVWEKSKMFD